MERLRVFAAGASRRLSGHGLWPAAILLVAVSAVARWLWSRGVAAPWIPSDESLYGMLGRSLAGEPTVVAGGVEQFALVTPALVAIPLAFTQDLAEVVRTTQAVQAVAMSVTAALVFAWARKSASDRWALAAAALTVAVPGLAYSGLLMTEAAFYPAVTLALFVLARVIENPTRAGQVLFAATCALAIATRLQGVALLPAAVLAVLAAALIESSPRLVRELAPLIGAIVLAGTGVLAALLAGAPALGTYSEAARGGYDLGRVATDLWQHAGAVFLLVAGVPLVALLALIPTLRRAPGPLRALVAVTLAWSVVLVVQVGIFASRYVGHLAERDLLTAAPPLFAVLAAWLSLGAPRPRPWAYAGALALAAPPLLLPIADLATREATLDSFSTIGFRKLTEATSASATTTVWAVWAGLLLASAAIVPARGRWLLAGLVAVTLLPLSVVASREVREASQADQRWWFSDSSPRWLDETGRGPVTFLYAGTGDWGAVWKTAFWNRRLDRVVTIGPERIPGAIEQSRVEPRFDGRLYDTAGAPLAARYLLAPRGMVFAGEVVGSVEPSGTLPGLDLWRVRSPAVLGAWVRGLTGDGTLAREGFVTGWGCEGGRLALTLVGLGPADVRVGAPRWVERRATVNLGEVHDVEVPSPPGDRCEFAMATTAPVAVRNLRIVRPGGESSTLAP